MLTAVVIDDMEQAIQALLNDLNRFCPEVKVIGTAKGVVEAAKKINQLEPELVFLDIMMGDGTGFDLLEICDNLDFKVIFTTASDEHALRAFRYAAVDYLLKPIDSDDLITAVKKAEREIGSLQDQIPILREAYENAAPGRIALASLEKVSIIDIKDVMYCQADNNVTLFYFENGNKILVSKTLKHYDKILAQQGFLRCHQSYLVNCAYIKSYHKLDGGYLELMNGKKIPVATRRRTQVVNWLDQLAG